MQKSIIIAFVFVACSGSGCGEDVGSVDGASGDVAVADASSADLVSADLGGGADVATCQSLTCAEVGRACGTWPGADGCGGALVCGGCGDGHFCNGDGHCQEEPCEPDTCASLGVSCDEWSDSCGAVLACGTCDVGWFCDAGGQCQEGACVPETCQSLVKQCGVWPDGCDDFVTCPGCPEGEHCSNQGQCVEDECQPQSCEGLAIACGQWSDGCEGTMYCGGCAHGEYCDEQGRCQESCAGIPLYEDGVLDLNLEAVRVTGSVSLAGSSLPDQGGSRGTLRFVERTSSAFFELDLGENDPLFYDIRLPPGRYDLWLNANESLCLVDEPFGMPCVDGRILSEVPLTADGVLNVDIPVVSVQGNVTTDGTPMGEASAERGALRFHLVGGGVVETPDFGASGPASYALRLLPGAYAVWWRSLPSLCNEGAEPPVPCNDGPVMSGLSLAADGALDVDVSTVRVSGSVLLDGVVLPDEQGERGHLRFTMVGGSIYDTEPIGDAGAAHYAVTLLSGNYAVAWRGEEALCQGDTRPAVPCNDGLVMNNVPLTQDGALDIDLDAVEISGLVTFEHGACPVEDRSAGRLWFRRSDGGMHYTPSLPDGGSTAYEVTLLAGDYNVGWDGDESLCASSPVPRVPCNAGPLLGPLPLTNDGSLDVDVPVVKVQGTVTQDEAVMPVAPDSLTRGHIAFRAGWGDSFALADFEAAGAMNYEVALLPGDYTVWWYGNAAMCTGDEAPGIPCNAGPIATAALTADGALNPDVAAVHLQGALRLEGATLPDAPRSRGALVFRLDGGSALRLPDIDPDGAVYFDVTLLEGDYFVDYDAESALCDGEQAPLLPCADENLVGCDD